MLVTIRFFILIGVFALGFICCVPRVSVDSESSSPQWERIGPGGGGSTFIPTFSFHNPDNFLVRCDMTGSYLTCDGGNSYQLINFANGASCFAYSPNDSNIIYIGSTALNRSKDGGKTWEQVFPKKDEIEKEIYIGDHAEYQIETIDSSLYIQNEKIGVIRVDPALPQTLYFTMGPYFFYSSDDGLNWFRKDLHQQIDNLYTNKTSAKNEVYIFTPETLFIFNKSSKTITQRDISSAMSPAVSFTAGTLKNSDKPVFYALHHLSTKENAFAFTNSEIWISEDLGISWTPTNDSIITNERSGLKPCFTMIVCAENDAANAYVVTNNYEVKNEEKTSTVWYGALKTSDAGKSWNWVWKGGGGSGQYGIQDASDAENLNDAWVHKAFGGEFIQLIDAGVSPQDGNIAIVTDWYRTMKTTDGGKSWREIYSISNPDGTYTSRGMDVTTTYGVHFDPFDKSHIAISYTDIGFHDSSDGGKSWERSVNGVPIEWVNTCYDLVFDPDIKGKMWSGWSALHDFPRGKMTRNPNWKKNDYAKGGICVSTDGGKNWNPLMQGTGDNSLITSIIIDRNSPPGNRTLYSCAFNKGVFKSTDDGKTWSLKNKGIGENTCAFRITQAVNGYLFLVVSPTPAHKNGKKGRDFYSGAVYRSVDNAETWTKLNIGGDLFFPNELTADHTNPDVLYLACWSAIHLSDLVGRDVIRATGGDELINMPGGIFKSDDGGETWKSNFGKEQHVYGITVDPYHKDRLYCNTFDKAAWRSDDTGKTWYKIKGYDFHWGHRVIVDPHHQDKVFLTTFGSSVWHGYPETEN